MQQDDEADEAVGGGSDDGGYGADLGGALGVGDLPVGALVHTVDEEDDDALQEEGKKKNDDETREVVRTNSRMSLCQSRSRILEKRCSCGARAWRSII